LKIFFLLTFALLETAYTHNNICCKIFFMINVGLQHVIDIMGGQSALARAIGTSQQNVHNWLYKRRIPAEYVLKIEEAVNGVITRHALRPDIYPLEEK
jgi:hypothetical protein